MKSFRFILCVSVLLAHVAWPAMGQGAPSSPEQLRSQLEAANKAKDVNAVSNLVNWKGVAADMKTTQARSLTYMATQQMAVVTLLPLPSDAHLTNELNGVRYFPNVEVLGIMQMRSTNKNGGAIQMPYGKSGNSFYLAGVAQETFDPNAKKAVSLSLNVSGTGVLDCSYVYVNGGKEMSESFKCTNNWSVAFWGDYIKSCKVTRAPGPGSLQLRVDENAKPVFDSGPVETNAVLTYEKK